VPLPRRKVLARYVVDQRQAPDVEPVVRAQRCAGIEADIRRAKDERLWGSVQADN
jgi:hypothetical protein